MTIHVWGVCVCVCVITESNVISVYHSHASYLSQLIDCVHITRFLHHASVDSIVVGVVSMYLSGPRTK